jgi:ACS family tartrate transporter-like MFS transporter
VGAVQAAEGVLERATRKALVRILPLCFICYVVAYVDRTNVALAKLTMSQSLPWLDDVVFGRASGIFFWGYFLLEIPGSILVERWSARKWIGRIMITWGLVAAATAFVRSPAQLHALRFGLGLAEAGFFPGVVVHLTHWFTSRERARALSLFLIATPVAQLVSPKITGAIAGGAGATVLGVTLRGWQWMFIAWGLPATALGVLVLFFLTDRPRDARWLAPDERAALEDALAREGQAAARERMTLAEALRHPKVLLLTLTFFCSVAGGYGLEFFLPSILQSWYRLKMSDITTYMLLPAAAGIVGQLLAGWSSDRARERRLHAALPLYLATLGFLGLSQSRGNLALTIACVTITVCGTKSYMPAFWSLPSLFLAETAAAGSIGFINSFGNLGGGGIGAPMMGALKAHTGSYVAGLLVLAAATFVAGTIILSLGLGRRAVTAAARSAPRSGSR